MNTQKRERPITTCCGHPMTKCEDMNPKYNGYYLTYCEKINLFKVVYWAGTSWLDFSQKPSHWMSLLETEKEITDES
jgi:hypothetical protein